MMKITFPLLVMMISLAYAKMLFAFETQIVSSDVDALTQLSINDATKVEKKIIDDEITDVAPGQYEILEQEIRYVGDTRVLFLKIKTQVDGQDEISWIKLPFGFDQGSKTEVTESTTNEINAKPGAPIVSALRTDSGEPAFKILDQTDAQNNQSITLDKTINTEVTTETEQKNNGSASSDKNKENESYAKSKMAQTNKKTKPKQFLEIKKPVKAIKESTLNKIVAKREKEIEARENKIVAKERLRRYVGVFTRNEYHKPQSMRYNWGQDKTEPPSAGEDCSISIADLNYESCTTQDNYLENDFQNAGRKGLCPAGPGNFNANCVLFAQNLSEASLSRNHFGSCPTPNGKPVRGIAQPCSSPANVNCMTNAFDNVTDCLGINPKSVFPLLAHESGFNINAISHTGCAGVGQLCGSAIDDVNKQGGPFLEMINTSNKPSCQALRGKVRTGFSARPSERCQFMRPPESPLNSFFYIAAFLKINKSRVDPVIESLKGNLSGLTAEQIELLKDLALQLSYNGGAGAARAIMRSYLSQVRSAKDFDTSSERSAFINFIANDLADTPARKREVSRYLYHIQGKLKKIDKAVGAGVCTRNGSLTK